VTTVSHVISEAEQLLLYSIPGSVLFLFGAIFLLLFQRLSISTELVAGAVVATIPVGFLIFQAYTSNLFWIYERVNRRKDQRTLKLLENILRKSGIALENEEEFYRLSKRIQTYLTNRSSDASSSYVWRLIDILNARGVCILSIILAGAVPLLFPYVVTGFDINVLCANTGVYRILIYYLMLIACGCCLLYGVPKVRNQLDTYSGILLCSNVDEVELIAKKWTEISSEKST